MNELHLRANKLFDDLRSFINHRERMMEHYGALKTEDRMKAISRMKNELNIFQHNPPKSKATYVLRCNGFMQMLAAGKSSKYYDSDQDKIYAMLEEAESIIADRAQALRADSMTTRAGAGDTSRPGSFIPKRYAV